MDYKQPDFYHFSEDSLVLVEQVLSFQQKEKIKLLDIGAGCGVLGIELANKCAKVSEIVFLEPQEVFHPFLKFNIENILNRNLIWTIRKNWLSEFEPASFFDLIICNPPYFNANAGRKSPQREKQICRSFEKDNPKVYLEKIHKFLSPQGMAFMLIPDHLPHWKNAMLDFEDSMQEIKKLNSVSIFLIGKENID